MHKLNSPVVAVSWLSALLMWEALISVAVAQDDLETWYLVESHTGCKFYNPIEAASNPVQWTGRCENGSVQGEGNISYHTDRGEASLSGVFVNGIMTGPGEMSTWVVHDGKRKRSHYTGAFKNGVMHGQGRLEIVGFAVYEGEFEGGLPNGQVVLTVGDAYMFNGTFKDGYADGPGVLEIGGESGGRYTGVFQGAIKDLKIIGKGTLETDGEEGYRYVGEFEGTTKQGYGVMEFANGSRYEGDFRDGWRYGYGKEILPNGNSCEGVWKKKRLVGYGMGRMDGKIIPCLINKNGQMTFVTDN